MTPREAALRHAGRTIMPVVIGDETLVCPQCGSNCLHQGAIEVFHRRREDADNVVLAIAEGMASDVSDIPDAGARNPSARRQGLLIHFDCEGCDLLQLGIVLTISQHKGETFIQWRRPAGRIS